MKYIKKYNEGYREVPEDTTKHCPTVEKFMKYFKMKMMNAESWFIDSKHLPKINDKFIASIKYDKEDEIYNFYPSNSHHDIIWGVEAEYVTPSIRKIMEKSECNYINFSTTEHNYGSLLYYKTESMRYTKSLDPDDIDEDKFAQYIMETLIDQKFEL